MSGVYIAAAGRSPIGRLNGALAGLSAAEIGAQVVRAVLADAKVDPGLLDDVIVGQVLQGGAGQNPARQTAIRAGVPASVPAMTINMVCGAGQRSIHLAAQAIKAGDAQLVLAGGQDSMTQAPHALYGIRDPASAGDRVLKDLAVVDGLWDAFHDIHMLDTVEQLASRSQITRAEQDEFALASQRKAAHAIAAGEFAREIVPVVAPVKRGEHLVSADEHPRPDVTLERLSAMSSVREGGTITAANASGLNDGASAVLVGSETRLAELGVSPLVRVASYASGALEPMDMGLGPVLASRRALELAGWSVADLDCIELNEAFAAQAIAVNRAMGWDEDLVNPSGGAIALGHPLAASGNRIVTTLVHRMVRENRHRGLAALCIGGGQGVAICLER